MSPFHAFLAKRAASAAALTIIATTATFAQLPGGANSLVETYDDWGVVCQAAGETTSCFVRQVQTDRQSNQQVLTVEIAALADGTFTGAILLPLGLSLSQGAQLKIGETALEGTRSFSTCIPQGCLVPLTISEDTLAALRAGTALSIAVLSAAPEQPLTFTVSLKGFSNALNRIGSLTE